MAVNQCGCNLIGRVTPFWERIRPVPNMNFYHFVIVAGTVYFEPANKQGHLTDDT
jgi:hypothetical protein